MHFCKRSCPGTGFPGVTDPKRFALESVSTGIQKTELDPGSAACGLVRETRTCAFTLKQLAVACIFFGTLVSCSIKTPADPLSKTKPYKVRGRWYKPQKHYEYQAVGHASWYGPGFHGKKNSCGYAFNENFLCAAHRTLPLPSIVRVTNVKTGKSIKVLVVDRGPFIDTHKRIIDLSKGAAHKLGTHGAGLGYVYVTSLPKESALLAQYVRRYQSHYRTRRLNWDKIYKRHFCR